MMMRKNISKLTPLVVQLASGALVTKAYGGAGADQIWGKDGNATLRDDSAADTIQVDDWLLSELNKSQNHGLIRSYN